MKIFGRRSSWRQAHSTVADDAQLSGSQVEIGSRRYPPHAAVEILHNFSLVHDDIEDVSPTRRGRKTVWKIWGEAQAINSGDAMFAVAHLALAKLADNDVPPATTVRALRRFDETCLLLTQGQYQRHGF